MDAGDVMRRSSVIVCLTTPMMPRPHTITVALEAQTVDAAVTRMTARMEKAAIRRKHIISFSKSLNTRAIEIRP